MEVEIRIFAGNRNIEQRIGNRLRREIGEALEKTAAFRRQPFDRGYPGRDKTDFVVITHQVFIEPVQHRLAPLSPQSEITGKTSALSRDVRASLFEAESEAAEFGS